MCCCYLLFFFFKQKTAYEMRISDWSSDVCSSDLSQHPDRNGGRISLSALQPADIALRKSRFLGNRLLGQTPVFPQSCEISPNDPPHEIGRASCRERVCQYV